MNTVNRYKIFKKKRRLFINSALNIQLNVTNSLVYRLFIVKVGNKQHPWIM